MDISIHFRDHAEAIILALSLIAFLLWIRKEQKRTHWALRMNDLKRFYFPIIQNSHRYELIDLCQGVRNELEGIDIRWKDNLYDTIWSIVARLGTAKGHKFKPYSEYVRFVGAFSQVRFGSEIDKKYMEERLTLFCAMSIHLLYAGDLIEEKTLDKLLEVNEKCLTPR